MRALPDEDTSVNVDLSSPPMQPGSIDPSVLRRAMTYGQKSRARHPDRPFRDAEADLRAGWAVRGESTEWEWVRAAARVGYEQDADDDV